MEKETVVEVKFERMDTVDCALGIMYLTELKSDIRYSVLDINVKNGYIIAVMYEVFFEDYRDRLKKKVGRIISSTKRVLYEINEDDIKGKIKKLLTHHIDAWIEDQTGDVLEPIVVFMLY